MEKSGNSTDKTDFEQDSDSENSDNALKIDLNQSFSPQKEGQLSSKHVEENIIQTIEQEIGKQLNEKAEKNNLTVTNVKTIIRQVLTNEHVRALLVTGDNDFDVLTSYEPKLTRAKAKELIISSNTPVSPVSIPWVPQPPPSETHVLIGDDLKEDDSGDEYVPGEEESEDDRDESIASESEISSLPPPTPPTPVSMEDQGTQTTNYTEDGVFKIPPPKEILEEALNEAANIALRTRSKINLSSTPLEVIEKSFVPPDVPLDMYDMEDMECEDEEWREFLKGFNEPLEEIVKHTEDEEQDPEYNILADDEINQVDNEDFRVDKAVKISKKEVKELWEELFDYLHNMSEEYGDQNDQTLEVLNTTEEQITLCQNDSVLTENRIDENLENCTNKDESILGEKILKAKDKCNKSVAKENNCLEIIIPPEQLYMLEQQMRQHIQMLTQNFLLTYEHPELHELSIKFREYLLNLKFLGDGKQFSLFKPVSLMPALDLTDSWIDLFSSNNEEVKSTRMHVQQELIRSLNYKMAGNFKYILTFPKLILETISKSSVFLYPSLLPKIPFKSEQFYASSNSFTDAEDSLLAFGLDMFNKYLLEQNKEKVTLKDTVSLIKEYLMPTRSEANILKHIIQSKHPRCASNPIKLYVLHGKLRPVIHYLYNLNQVLPPCKRLPQELPEQWKNFIYPRNNQSIPVQNILRINGSTVPQLLLINTPIVGTSTFSTPISFLLTSATPEKKIRTRSRKNTSLPAKFNAQNASTPKNIGNKYLKTINRTANNCVTVREFFRLIFLNPIPVQKLIRFFSEFKLFVGCSTKMINAVSEVENNTDNEEQGTLGSSQDVSSITGADDTTNNMHKMDLSSEHKKPEIVTSSTLNKEIKNDKGIKNLEFSTIVNTNFQQANNSSEVEFCRNSSDVQICQTSQSDDKNESIDNRGIKMEKLTDRDNPEDINAFLLASSTVKPNIRKELSGAEKKKNKIRKDFLANLSITIPEDPEREKHKNEMFAMAYYDKLLDTLDIQDYNKVMQILSDFDSGSVDVIDLYKNIQPLLRSKYRELEDEFLCFLKEREAAAVGQLVPWLEIQTRTKFLRKLEIYFKDQPAQIRKIYKCIMDLNCCENLTMDKIKSSLLPMLKGNTILIDLFLQGFREERPPPSLLEGPYETIDINKEMTRADNEDRYETFVVPNIEDKYGGQNCICHCHKIEDNEYKSRYKHCKSCGLKFANGKPLLQSGRSLVPATVTFEMNPDDNHAARLIGISCTTSSSSHKKKRSDSSPNKHVNSSGKENLDEDTEDEDVNKRKKSVSQKTPRKRRKTEQDTIKPLSPKKSPARSSDSSDVQKDYIKPRKRTYSAKRSKREDCKKTDSETDKTEDNDASRGEKLFDEDVEIIAGASDEQQCKSVEDDCMDSSGESIEKPLTPGQQTAESESDIYLEESSQDNYESDDSSSSTESTKGSQSDNNTSDEQAWKRQEDTIILETLQKEDDKEYALQIISEKLPNRTISQIRNRLSRLMDLLIETLKNT